MDHATISLDDWFKERINRSAVSEREALRAFQKEWLEGNRSNPLLFPVTMDQSAWQDEFEWFAELERIMPPRARVGSTSASPSARPAAQATRRPAAADAATVVLDRAPAGPPSAALETVVVEDGRLSEPALRPNPGTTAGQETVVIDPAPPRTQSDRPAPSAPPSLETVIMEAESPSKRPKQSAADTDAPPDAAATVIMDVDFGEASLDDLETLILEDTHRHLRSRRLSESKTAPAEPSAEAPPRPEKKPPKKEAPPSSQPLEASREKPAPEAKAKPTAKNESDDLDLDLSDLDL